MASPLDLPYDTAPRCERRHAWFKALRPPGRAALRRLLPSQAIGAGTVQRPAAGTA
jgi:hypothetical protein